MTAPPSSPAMSRPPIRLPIPVLACVTAVVMACGEPPADTDDQDLRETVERLTLQIAQDADNVELYSQRGDARFFLGRFSEALADYDRMVELKPGLDASHWRRGIALFYTGRYADAAAQFERYHSFDNVDRENGIWRYLSHAMLQGPDKARAELLRYETDDREPFPDVYRLFAGSITPEAILEHIAAADISDQERSKREFYAYLYIGLHYAVLKQNEPARAHLRKASGNTWAPQAGYGPHYMWRVARLHAAQLDAKLRKEQASIADDPLFPATACGCRQHGAVP